MPTHKQFPGLSEHLIASFYPLTAGKDDKGRIAYVRNRDEGEVLAPITASSMEMALTWTSPFENSGAEGVKPALAQMLQSGLFSDAFAAFGLKGSIAKSITDKFDEFAGRTGITKVNSTQIFNGMPPVKLTMTAFFRAFRHPGAEVEAPIRKLQEWALPQKIEQDGLLASQIRNGLSATGLMPSFAPRVIGVFYKNRNFSPMVIESISDPIDAPIDGEGKRISALVQMTICSLTAWDKDDLKKTFSNTY